MVIKSVSDNHVEVELHPQSDAGMIVALASRSDIFLGSLAYLCKVSVIFVFDPLTLRNLHAKINYDSEGDRSDSADLFDNCSDVDHIS